MNSPRTILLIIEFLDCRKTVSFHARPLDVKSGRSSKAHPSSSQIPATSSVAGSAQGFRGLGFRVAAF